MMTNIIKINQNNKFKNSKVKYYDIYSCAILFIHVLNYLFFIIYSLLFTINYSLIPLMFNVNCYKLSKSFIFSSTVVYCFYISFILSYFYFSNIVFCFPLIFCYYPFSKVYLSFFIICIYFNSIMYESLSCKGG